MNQSENIQDLIKSLLEAEKDFEVIKKSLTGQSGNRTFKYADLTEVYDKTKPSLRKNGLKVMGHLSVMEDGSNCLSSTIYHISGQWISSQIKLICESTKPTDLGAVITYMRRYLYVTLLGISADEEIEGDDLNSASENKKPEIKMLSDSDILKLSLALSKKMEFSNTDKLAEYLMKFKKNLASVANPLESLCSDKFTAGYEKWLAENPPAF